MFRQFTAALMILTLLFSQGVSALVVQCEMENMTEMNHGAADMQHDMHMDVSEHSASIQKQSMQSNQDCCDNSCECEHGTAFSMALFVANPFPDSLIAHSNVITEQFRALDAHSSDLIKPPIF